MPALLRAPSREYRTIASDSHFWDGYKPRADDIVIATYPKCGTTWTQRIVDLLVFQSPAPRHFLETSPWLDCTFFAPNDVNLAMLEAQTHRRFIKSHLPFDSLPVFDGVKYIHVVRDGRDACWSFHNHQLGFRQDFLIGQIAARNPGQTLPFLDTPRDPRDYFLQWMDSAEADAPGELSFFDFENTYWRERKRPNLLFVHYADLKADLGGQMRRIAGFLGIETPPDLMAELVEAARFETMKAQGDEMMPQLRTAFDRGAERFINKGTNGRWKDVLTPEDLARYDALVRRKFAPAQARWIEHGGGVAGDPAQLAD
ncbi:MAG TPA: sulfotransferase domain-containing protein [Rhizomicrobium sp.]|nr:sulfotransferase domain-containing protein [Rhizomicrobium sp.]